MKNLFCILFLFVFSISAFSATRIGYYGTSQNKDIVLENAKLYEKDMIERYHMKMNVVKTINKYDYTQTWEFTLNSAKRTATMHYQFYDDRVEVTMSNPTYTTSKGTTVALSPNDPMEFKKSMYEKLENMMVDIYFKYLLVSETKPDAIVSKSTASNNYDSVTKKYSESVSKEQAKQKSQLYNTTVLSKQYSIFNLGDRNADVQNIKFIVNTPSYHATIVVHYEFRAKDFTIQIKSFEHYNNTTKATTIISKNIDSHKKFYDMTKEFLLDKPAAFISAP